MSKDTKAFMVGSGIGSLAAAAFMIRDGEMSGRNITILEALPVLGGSLDGGGNPETGYTMRGGRMLTTDNYECTWELFKSIPSLEHPGKSVFDETVEFNEVMKSCSKARLIDRNRSIVDVKSMGFTMADRTQLLELAAASEDKLGSTRITDWLSPEFFTTNFWYMWSTTFAFQPWHSAVEFKRYLHRFMKEFSRIETLAGVKRTVYNQYDSLVKPLVSWLTAQQVQFRKGCAVTDIVLGTGDKILVTELKTTESGNSGSIPIRPEDLVLFQNGTMTDASTFGSMTKAPAKLTKADTNGWSLWEKLATGRPEFGNPAAFNSSIPESNWPSFTVTLKDTVFFDKMEAMSGNKAGTGGLVTFKDSNWYMSVVLAYQPHYANQPDGVQVFWGYALHGDRVGNFVPKPMADCNGEEILRELCGHLNFDQKMTFANANCIPCRMPYITSQFMPRAKSDRPLPVPKNSKNLAFVSQYVEIPDDVVFTVEYSVRVAQMVVYQLLKLDHEIPAISRHDESVKVKFDAVLKAFA